MDESYFNDQTNANITAVDFDNEESNDPMMVWPPDWKKAAIHGRAAKIMRVDEEKA